MGKVPEMSGTSSRNKNLRSVRALYSLGNVPRMKPWNLEALTPLITDHRFKHDVLVPIEAARARIEAVRARIEVVRVRIEAVSVLHKKLCLSADRCLD